MSISLPGKWPADHVERRAIASLNPYARNPRSHSEDQIKQIARSISEFGWTIPVLVDEDSNVIAGHGRIRAATTLGIVDAPVMVARGWTKSQIRAYRIADNELVLRGEWDKAFLKLEIKDLSLDGFDLSLTGFSDFYLKRMSRTDDYFDAIEPEPPRNPVTRTGDVWILGNHRLVCGDTTQDAVVDVALNGTEVDCVFTSPPYAVGLDYPGYHDSIDNLREMLPKLARIWMRAVVAGGYAVIDFADIANAKDFLGTPEPCEYPMALEYWPVFRAAGWFLYTRRIYQKPHHWTNSPWTAHCSRASTDWEHVWTWKKPGKVITHGSGTAVANTGDSSTNISQRGIWGTDKNLHGSIG
jgi:hypothetical protein